MPNIKLKKNLEILLVKKYENYLALLEQEVRECAKESIKEDMGGLTNSIHTIKREVNYKGGAVVVDVPYAKYVNDGRGAIVPKEKEVLSNMNTTSKQGKGNWNTSTKFGQRIWNSQGGHSPFVAKYAGPFKGYHFIEEAIKRVKQAIERGNV